MTPLVVGADLSLTSTGLASNDGRVLRRQTKPRSGADPVADAIRRMDAIESGVWAIGAYTAALLVVEGPSYASVGGSQHERAGLWWRIALAAANRAVPLLVVTPGQLKKYATGNGSASKDQVLAAVVKRYASWDVTGNDVADAVVLMAIGARLLGHPVEESLPQTHLRALDKLALPAGMKESKSEMG